MSANIGWQFYRGLPNEIINNHRTSLLNKLESTLSGKKESDGSAKKIQRLNKAKSPNIINEEDFAKAIQKLNKEKIFDLKLQDYQAQTKCENLQNFELETTYPGLLIGSGYAHEMGIMGELKLGFFFDHTTGMPIVPGSSVKGVLKSAFPSFGSKKKYQVERARYIYQILNNLEKCPEEISKEDEAKINLLEKEIFEGESKGKPISIYERDIFFDAIIVKSNNRENKFLASDYITPHGNNPLKNPTPLQFLKILPQVVFRFQFDLKDGVISAKAKKALFQKILEDQGIGAKTNVGYGQFK